jgi:hypothetical protein
MGALRRMEWQRYKRYCGRPEYFSRWALVESAAILGRARPVDELLGVLNGTRLEKPESHKGGPETDYFRITLPAMEARRIVQAVEAHMERLEGRSYRQMRHLLQVWKEYLESLSDPESDDVT